MANQTEQNATKTPTATATKSDNSLICAEVNVVDKNGNIIKEQGYVMATGKFEAINMILQHYATEEVKVVEIPVLKEAKNISFVIS